MGAVVSRFKFTGYKVYNHHKENSQWALLWLQVFISSEFLGLDEANDRICLSAMHRCLAIILLVVLLSLSSAF